MHSKGPFSMLSWLLILAGLQVDAVSSTTLELTPLGTYETGVFDGGAAEISAYLDGQRMALVTNADTGAIDILDLRDAAQPELVGSIDLSPWGSGANSVAASGGIVAIAIEAEIRTDPGTILLLDLEKGVRQAVTVGALPDMVTFTPDGTKAIAANEGEPEDDIDPKGSISVIDLSSGVGHATVETLDFTAYDGRENELRNRGVRIFPEAQASADLEPEFVAVAPDSRTAFVTLQEANAFAIVDLVAQQILDVAPLGVKDHGRGLPAATVFDFPRLPGIGRTATSNPQDPSQTTPGQSIRLGGLSGLWLESIDPGTGRQTYVTVPDRGPNGDTSDVDGDGEEERPFALPDYQARVVRFELDPATGKVTLLSQILLTQSDGVTPITGLPNIPGVDEEPVDLWGNHLRYDPFGADLEGIAIASDGSYWMVDEYRPSIYHFDPEGVLIDRLVPVGTGSLGGKPAGTYGTETLPAEYALRRRNRGFEGMALDPTAGLLYGFIQTPLENPDRSASDASDVIRVLAIDLVTGSPVSEYVYLLEAPDHRDGKVDKIGDAAYAGNGEFFSLERDSSAASFAKKYIFHLDLKGATNLLDPTAPDLLPGRTLEEHTADDLAELGIVPIHKRKVANLPSLGYAAGDKPEGLALLPGGDLAVLNDNDFALADAEIPVDGTILINPDPIPVQLGLIEFSIGNGLDPSNEDGEIAIANWPVFGMYMPDAIAAFEIAGDTYFATANEGDARNSDERIRDLSLDPVRFPDAAIQDDEQLGRLNVSSIDGDLDGDGLFDELYAYGARSMSIWDSFGNLVWDSGDLVAQRIALDYPESFNSTNDDNDSFDSRSDDKGAEPEAITVGQVNGRTLVFLGLERMGGVIAFDVTDPTAPTLLNYVNNRDFSGDPEMGTAGDLAPEGIVFVAADDVPAGDPMLLVSNEVSGTVTIYAVRRAP